MRAGLEVGQGFCGGSPAQLVFGEAGLGGVSPAEAEFLATLFDGEFEGFPVEELRCSRGDVGCCFAEIIEVEGILVPGGEDTGDWLVF